jgi:predicted small secreted protein
MAILLTSGPWSDFFQEIVMKTIAMIAAVFALALSATGCNTWSGVKQDAKVAGQAAGQGIEKAGEKIKEVAK